MNFKVDDDYKPAKIQEDIPTNNISDDRKDEGSKPTFNLRLKDRKKNETNDDGGYKPPGLSIGGGDDDRHPY